MSSSLGFSLNLRNCFRCGLEFRGSKGERVCSACRKPTPARGALVKELSLREKQIIDLVRQAKANKEIAYELHLTEGTVKEYLNRIFKKLGARNRTEVAIWAMSNSTGPRRTVPVPPEILKLPPYLTTQ